ncbi:MULTISPECIES: 5-dehydro-4-deoxy-D-glucuronate isomerase [Saccharibacillus]|uniref:4-deoxy-L-threo-5-hexosulose-uronate ketol-isomerase n=1 Tax=Saccharibacillus brassicae TaxID=2583377 RepID=A0A4Y6USJ5_SACBS|nr:MULTISPECIES: 5-dehydro-4-deoxy-D-glucuronate isomerase [Saccharibacillus]MWJ29831.1 5-dehydro-4-deoxy-D-glucuronate isomerase [Saccharibacillus sp. WB 17]QDH20652.1 5-dehydro-4-deoxy-D-glucuronate isomerase [Saccharibacillus brassicae]
MENRYASHPNAVKTFDTTQLREEFLIETLFAPDQLVTVYSHVDRYIVGSAVPVSGEIKLEVDLKQIGADYFLERREVGIINVGGEGSVTADGETFEVGKNECLYVGLGVRDVTFRSADGGSPARFYLVSTPAHKAYPTRKAGQGEAIKAHLGSIDSSNERTINKYILPGGIESCQLVMGITELAPGNMWNTMPCHTHNRRSEVYLYFNMPEDAAVFHFMGEPQETRHLVVRNQQAVISPSWSIHSGVGTNNYTFCWAMGGENQLFDDMDAVDMKDLK